MGLFTEFCCKTGGSNLNAGTRSGTSTEPGTAADFTYASGTWVAGTGVFTPASGNPLSDGVAVGDFASVYPDGSTLTPFIGRVTARDATTITVSTTVKSGTAPTDGTNTRTCKVGGAWKGPNAAEAFPFGFITNALVNAAGDMPRVNLKSAATFAITAAMSHGNVGNIRFQGYTTSYGDGGKATIDGGTSGTSYVLLTASVNFISIFDLIFQNNGATASANGVSLSGVRGIAFRCVFHDLRGTGLILAGETEAAECEFYNCNQNNSSLVGCAIGNGSMLRRSISHDNTTGTSSGFSFSANALLDSCIAESNGLHGFLYSTAGQQLSMSRCDAYNNGGDGLRLANSSSVCVRVENCNFVKNGGWGVNGTGAGVREGHLLSCCFGTGTQANTSGTTAGLKAIDEIGSMNYAADVTPWVDPANGDFRINLAAAKNMGRGNFTQTAPSYTGTVGYPDIGAAQHQETGGAAGPVPMIGSPFIRGAGRF